MSRHEIEGDRPGRHFAAHIVVGYDRPLDGYFADIWKLGSDDPENAHADAILPTPNITEIEAALRPYVDAKVMAEACSRIERERLDETCRRGDRRIWAGRESQQTTGLLEPIAAGPKPDDNFKYWLAQDVGRDTVRLVERSPLTDSWVDLAVPVTVSGPPGATRITAAQQHEQDMETSR